MDSFDLDYSLMEVRNEAGQVGQWTVGHAVEGVQIFGGIGSGKTSGSGRTLALKFLRAGFGGLVLTAKPDEKELWENYCTLAGRSQDLIILEPGGSMRFNFLHYEATQAGGSQALTANIVQVLKTVIRAGEEKGGSGGDNAFWESALEMLIFNVIDLCQLAYDQVTVKDMYEVAQSIPQSQKQGNQSAQEAEDVFAKPFGRAYLAAKKKVDSKVAAWKTNLQSTLEEEAYEALWADDAKYQERLAGAVPETTLLQLLYDFFIGTLKQLSERTRSTIELMFTGFLFHLMREPVYSLFCSGVSTVTPEDSLRGKIILLNLPVKVYHKVGQDCQVLFKYIWQRVMEKRDVRENGRPLFLWADEAQNFLHEHDAVYQATARSSRIATVYISQNLPNYYASMGGSASEHRVKSFLGTLNTKIFHANADRETTEYASVLIGEDFHWERTRTVSVGESPTTSESESLKLARRVRPEEFYRLRTGGKKSDYKVEGYLLWQGNSLLRDQNHQKVTFNQHYGALAMR